MPRPKQEIKMTGRRPKRSDQAPRIGEKISCIAVQAKPKYAVITDARAKSPLSNCRTRSGSTGAMMPKARKSKATITRMKTKAAWPGFGASGEEGEDNRGS